MANGKILTPAERERVTKLCRVLTTERRIWNRRFGAWLNTAVAERNPDGLDRMLEHDPRTEALRAELLGYLRRMLPEREVGAEEITTMLDLYAATHGYAWNGERIEEPQS